MRLLSLSELQKRFAEGLHNVQLMPVYINRKHRRGDSTQPIKVSNHGSRFIRRSRSWKRGASSSSHIRNAIA